MCLGKITLSGVMLAGFAEGKLDQIFFFKPDRATNLNSDSIQDSTARSTIILPV